MKLIRIKTCPAWTHTLNNAELYLIKYFIIIIIVICNVSYVSSQSKQLLSGAVYTGAFFSGGDFPNIPKSGLNIGADLEARNNLFGMYTNFTYDISKVKGTVYNTGNETKIIHIIEIYLGPRWYIGGES